MAKRFHIFWRILIPLLISGIVVGIIFSQEFYPEAFKDFAFTERSFLGIILGIIALILQNLFMAQRYKSLAGDRFSISAGLRVQQMMEFSSVATPSSVGGSGALFIFLSAEGISAGKATAITFSSLFLDELAISLLSLIVIFFSFTQQLFSHLPVLSDGLALTFYIVTFVIIVWTTILGVILFYRPQILSSFVRWCSKWRLLKKYASKIDTISQEILIASRQMSKRSFTYWLKLLFLSLMTWIVRFAIAVCLIYGFSDSTIDFSLSQYNLFNAFMGQIVIWMTSMIMPTPGASGFAEYMFKVYYAPFFASTSIALVVGVIWRCLHSYIYLLTGGLFLSLKLPKMKIASEKEFSENRE